MRPIVIAGIDTDVGKTFTTTVIADTFGRMNRTVSICKPVQTGTDYGDSDPVAVVSALSEIVRLPPELEIPFHFRFPASPDYAARLEGRRIGASEIAEKVRAAAATNIADVLLIELAGGVLVPLNETETNLDLIAMLGYPVILVTHAKLGMVNHTLLSWDAMRRRGVNIAGTIINRFPNEPDPLATDNLETIRRFTDTPILAVIPESERGLPVLGANADPLRKLV